MTRGATAATEIKLPADGASEFDPDGDGSETESQNLAIDGNPTGTSWETEHYVTEDFGGFKDGVGLAIDAGETVTANSMEIRSPVSGWDAEIYQIGSRPAGGSLRLGHAGGQGQRRINKGDRRAARRAGPVVSDLDHEAGPRRDRRSSRWRSAT